MSVQELSKKDLEDLQYAKKVLEHPSFAARLANVAGYPIEKLIENLPDQAKGVISEATTESLKTALQIATSTMTDGKQAAWNWAHTAAVMASGAVGGAFGLPALVFELPISTTIMLRSIADVARSEGEDIATADGRLACLVVFAFGGRASSDDAVDSAYFAVRGAIGAVMKEAAAHIARSGVILQGAPPLVRFIAEVGARFGIQVSEKAMAQSIPIIGAAGGALVNTLFIDHFQSVARGHFIVRRLERTYDQESVRAAYEKITIQ